MASIVSTVTNLISSTLTISAPALDTTTEEPQVSLDQSVEPKQPDISYHPDEAKWKARTARRLAEDPSLPNSPLPEGFPTRLESPLIWEGKEWTDASQWEFELTPEHLKEIDNAVNHFRGTYHSSSPARFLPFIISCPGLDLPFGHISPSTFPLPTLGPILTNLAKELHAGRGFFVLRTIPVGSYSREDNVLIYAGVSSYVASKRGVQDTGDSVLAHIKDLTDTNPLKTIGAPAYTTDKQVFHTDIGDIISLFVLETAAEGGQSRISSSWKVYNELAETRPDMIKTLAEPWPLDT